MAYWFGWPFKKQFAKITDIQFLSDNEVMVKNSFSDFVKFSPIHWWTSEFVDASKELAYRQFNHPFQRTILLVYLSLGLIAAPLSAVAVWPNIVSNAGAILRRSGRDV